MKTRLYSGVLAVVMAASSLLFVCPAPVRASSRSRENAWRIGTYLGSAGTLAALAKGKGTLALIGGGATLLSYSQWRKEMRRRHRREDLATYRGYRTRWLRRYHGRRVIRR